MTNAENIAETNCWDRAIQGDKDAQKAIYLHNYKLILNFGLKYTKDRGLVEDCIQDVFVSLYTNKKISSGISVRSYLLKAVKNRILKKKQSRAYSNYPIDESIFEMPTDESQFEAIFHKGDDDYTIAKSILKSISKLSPKQKEIIYLRYIKNLSHKEIAYILDMNEQSSMNLANRAISKLRKLISADIPLKMMLIILTVLTYNKNSQIKACT